MKKTTILFFAGFIAMQNAKAQNWLTTGNAALTNANFIGTTDGIPLNFRVNNKVAGRIDLSSSKAITSFGYLALKSTTGAGNTAFGYKAMTANGIGYANTASGQYSMENNTDGYSNTAFGSEALRQNILGYFNTAIGQAALAGSTSFDNTAVGRYSLISLTTGNSNTALGSASNVNDGTLNNVTLLGDFATGTASNQVRVGNGSTTSIGGEVGWSTLSDARVKKNIKQNVPGLAFINKLQSITYNLDLDAVDNIVKAPAITDANGKTIAPSADYIAARKAKEKIIYSGFLAQDVEKIAKSMNYDFSGVDAAKNSKDLYGIRYAEFVVPLVKAVQELSIQNDELQKQLNEIKETLSAGNSTPSAAKSKTAANAILKISPNPAKNQFNVSGLKQGTVNYIQVTDLNGQTIVKKNSSNSTETIDISGFSKGMYMVTIHCGSETKSFKLVKE